MKIDKTMKRWVFILIAALAIFLTADLCARERGVKFSGGTDLVSTYVSVSYTHLRAHET